MTTRIPKAADLPVGTVVATEDLAGMKQDTGSKYGTWRMTNGGAYWDKHIDEMLAEGAQVLRWGTAPAFIEDLDPTEAARAALFLLGVEDTEENRAKLAAIPAKVAATIAAPSPAVREALTTDPGEPAKSLSLADLAKGLESRLRNARKDGQPLTGEAHRVAQDLLTSGDLAHLARALAQSAAGETVDLGDFTQYADDPAWVALGGRRFHTRETCPHLAASRSETTVERARALGLDVCNSCERAGLLPCGCLPNDADAHRVDCPRYPEGNPGHVVA